MKNHPPICQHCGKEYPIEPPQDVSWWFIVALIAAISFVGAVLMLVY